ncbi:ArnT family glycosyltransferase [Tundrisphaera sp. TA3]|uniref:ArnT family glycosyltransferase n=1 Tax=Tundrisphaera sp. TA3 TaxID=3435775 RepID=UPI003EBC9C20
MARSRPPRPRTPPPAPASAPPATVVEPSPPRPAYWTRPKLAVAVVLLLALQFGLAAASLIQENPTIDETAHLPAGVSYWQTGTFKLYHHNPPLVKLVAALPVVLANPVTAPLYQSGFWEQSSQSTFGEYFTLVNADRYFELFASARMMMPLFTLLGGLAVFAWSARLYGGAGGLISLALWTLCPNVLAHCRLVTTDAAAASFAVAATYLFWRYQNRPTWGRAALAGIVLGLAQLTKFSALILYGLWPTLAVVRFLLGRDWAGWPRRLGVGLGQGALMVALSMLVINMGYGFEGFGQPLGRFEFASRTLTRPTQPGMARPTSPNAILAGAWRYRINRFRGTPLAALPVPLPRHYVLGFDEQKIETEGIPRHFLNDNLPVDDSKLTGYPVYLNGVMKRSGWWYYYLATLAYKVPEGTWILVVLATGVLLASPRSRALWADEIAVLAIPVGILLAMTFLTDICLGLRYILTAFPFAFVATGKLAPWAIGQATAVRRRLSLASVIGPLLLTAAATASIHPHYLAYFNQVSGGPGRGSEHLIDSNLDWGQDLVKLNRWLKANHPGERVGLAYFGQINPSVFRVRGEGLDWFLPPTLPGTMHPMAKPPSYWIGPAPRLTPGLYAVSANLVRGLPWRFHDSSSLTSPSTAWSSCWSSGEGAFAYFQSMEPVAKIGYSIFVYRVTAEDCARINPLWEANVPGR